MKHLAKLNNLTSINLNNCYQITDDGLEHLASLKNLISIELSRCYQITDKGLRELILIENLTSIDLSGCQSISLNWRKNMTHDELNNLRNAPSETLGL